MRLKMALEKRKKKGGDGKKQRKSDSTVDEEGMRPSL